MMLLEQIVIPFQSHLKQLSFYEGDLTKVPLNEAFDLLVISAFFDDYSPTPNSLIGNLHRRGLSISELSENKEADLRYSFSCWLSKDVSSLGLGFRNVLCFEPSVRGDAPSLVSDIFRSIMPFALREPPIKSVGMPILAAGDQKYDTELMLTSLVNAAVHWMERGLPIDTIKIVVPPTVNTMSLRVLFREFASKIRSEGEKGECGKIYDYFVSYSHDNREEANAMVHHLKTLRPGIALFQDKMSIKIGQSWQEEIDQAIEKCQKMIPLLSPSYLNSRACMEEFNLGRLRHRENHGGVLCPIYIKTAHLPLYMRSIQYIDCRESDMSKIKLACSALLHQ